MRKLKRALVIANPKKPDAKVVAKKVRAFLVANGVSVVGGRNADLLIVVGGDGTLLYNKSKYELPVFAIGSRRSMICQATSENWKGKLLQIIRRGIRIEKRMMLACEVGGKVVENALNEIVIRSRDHRVIDLSIAVGKKSFNFWADGVIFSTPTGSSAYCYSAGGKELGKQARKYEVVAIAPYRRAFRPVIVPDSTVSSASTKSSTADLVFDGQFIRPVKPGFRISVYRSKRELELAL